MRIRALLCSPSAHEDQIFIHHVSPDDGSDGNSNGSIDVRGSHAHL